MDQRLSLVTLGVSDLAASTAFYERLGWRRSVRAAEGVIPPALNSDSWGVAGGWGW
jgi:catechol 2,3-dioxygenase-like lactoylglutathione lyase family enzyme